MDAKRFDTLTKAWISLPRRRLLGGLVAGTLAPLLGLGGREVSAVIQFCGEPGSPACPTGQVCKNGLCATTCQDPVTCRTAGGDECGTGCACGKGRRKSPSLCVAFGGGASCATAQGCRKHSQCERGHLCIQGCCGANDPHKYVCVPACDA